MDTPLVAFTQSIQAGQLVHAHNVRSIRGKELLEEDLHMMRNTFMGYRNADGSAGIRNHVVVLPMVICANSVVQQIEKRVPEVIAIPHTHGCTLIPGAIKK